MGKDTERWVDRRRGGLYTCSRRKAHGPLGAVQVKGQATREWVVG